MPAEKEISTLEKLQMPFLSSDIEWRVQSTGESNGKRWAMVLAYVTNRAIMSRLDEVFGFDKWKNDYKPTPNGKGTLCGISVKVNDEWVTKWDGSDDTATEATKGGLSGSMKRAGVQWGIGRYLYKLDATFAKCSTEKVNGWVKSYDAKTKKNFWWEIPELPSWALLDEEKSGRNPSPIPLNPAPSTPNEIFDRQSEIVEKIKNCQSEIDLKNLYHGLSKDEQKDFRQRVIDKQKEIESRGK